MPDSNRNAWPSKQYNGDTAAYDEYDIDRMAWLIDKGLDEHMSSANPRNTPRVEQGFWHTERRTGRRVTWVPPESPRSYKRRCDRYDAQEKKIWARAILGFSGAARTTALQAPQFDARALFAKIKEVHGDKSDVQITHIVRDFIGQTKTAKVNIDDFNRTWTEQLRVLKNNGMELPPKFIINLYMIALGPRYKMLEATVAVLSPQKCTLSHVMQLAVDHTGRSRGDEADHSDMALLSEIADRSGFTLSKKRNSGDAFAATDHKHGCANCGKPGHKKSECFAPGGGLAHMDYAARQQFLYNKRQRAWQQHAPAQSEQQHQPKTKTTEQANSAEQNNTDEVTDAAYLVRQIEDREETFGKLKDRIHEMFPAFDCNV
jgi:hypothetical protein